MNDAIKKTPINLKLSFLVIAKPTMLNNEFKDIKETLFQEFKKIRWWKWLTKSLLFLSSYINFF